MTRTAVLLGVLLSPWIAAAEQVASPGARTTAGTKPLAVQEASRALDAGDVERALRLAGQHLRRNPDSVAARLVMARAHIAREEYAVAFDQLRRAQRNRPDTVDVLYYLGMTAGRLADIELQRLARIAPDSARLHQVRAESLELQRRPHEAAAAYEAALARQPDLVDALLGLAKLRRTALQCSEAIELYNRAEALRPTFDSAYGLGVCLQYEQKPEVAAAQFRAATERDPGDALAWHGLGMTEMKLGRLPRAAAHLQHAIKLQPRMHDAYYALGQVYRAAGDLDKAKEAFAMAEQLQQDARQRDRRPEPQPPR